MSSQASAGPSAGIAAVGHSLHGDSSLRPARPCHVAQASLPQASIRPALALATHKASKLCKLSKAAYSHSQGCEVCGPSCIPSKPGPLSLSSEAVGRRRGGALGRLGGESRHVGAPSSHVSRAAAAAAPLSSSHGDVPEGHSSRDGEGSFWEAGPSREGGNESGSESSSAPPACMFVGPLEAADQSTLEEFYRQAKDSYYSGNPLILDEMFDRVEVHLRWLRSPVVQKYPRCSLQKNTTYADAEDDPSQLAALHGVWASLLALGGVLAAGPTLYTADMIWEHSQLEDVVLGIATMPGPMLTTTWLMLCAICTGLGLTLASSSWSALKGLRGGGLVALRGVCPSCTEEVYAFVKVDGRDKRPRHKTDCHVCGQRLVFHAILRQTGGQIAGTPSTSAPQLINSSSTHGRSLSPSNSRGSDGSSSGQSRTESGGMDRDGGDNTSSKRGSTTTSTSSSITSRSGTPLVSPWISPEPLRWVYGRVYAVAKPEDLRPSR